MRRGEGVSKRVRETECVWFSISKWGVKWCCTDFSPAYATFARCLPRGHTHTRTHARTHTRTNTRTHTCAHTRIYMRGLAMANASPVIISLAAFSRYVPRSQRSQLLHRGRVAAATFAARLRFLIKTVLIPLQLTLCCHIELMKMAARHGKWNCELVRTEKAKNSDAKLITDALLMAEVQLSSSQSIFDYSLLRLNLKPLKNYCHNHINALYFIYIGLIKSIFWVAS